MKTMSERIEAAAKWLLSIDDDAEAWERPTVREAYSNIAIRALEAAFPELFGDKPEMWLAPWNCTRDMVLANAHEVLDAQEYPTVESEWAAMRDAHLSPTHTKEGRET